MAGFLKFDPDNWEPQNGEGAAKPAKPAKVEPALATLATLASMPDELAEGVARLSRMAPPRGLNAKVWALAVQDAARLASEGWAAKALGLGWSALDLFGAVTDAGGDPAADGLAVRLMGRPVLAICGTFATVADGPSARSFLHHGNNEGARLLWELGRGR